MKKNIAILAGVFVITFLLSGCASIYPIGSLYTGVKLPNNMGDGKDISYTKIGKAQASSILCLVATGDASLEKAIQNGGIKTVKYVDYHVDNFLGIYGTYTTTAYGD
ncbi:MAG: TRL-like family protein [Candidatus Omnitrophica bacterium]|nr:TRL-like family protein [Candidatus Omnitrophota bacterium]